MQSLEQFNFPFTVDLWSPDGNRLRQVLAKCGDIHLARGAFAAAVKRHTDGRLTLRHGSRVVLKHPETD